MAKQNMTPRGTCLCIPTNTAGAAAHWPRFRRCRFQRIPASLDLGFMQQDLRPKCQYTICLYRCMSLICGWLGCAGYMLQCHCKKRVQIMGVSDFPKLRSAFVQRNSCRLEAVYILISIPPRGLHLGPSSVRRELCRALP